MEVKWCPSVEQVADPFTKLISSKALDRLMSEGTVSLVQTPEQAAAELRQANLRQQQRRRRKMREEEQKKADKK